MYRFQVNGTYYEAQEDQRLIDFLRADLKLTGTKEGCSAGACGTCTVIIDGKKAKACVSKLSQLDGKSIVTIEGLTDREKAVYTYAFGECGAVQCGFCIPGMIISAKVLIDENNDPTSEDVKKAILGNICRCTGYVKIEEGIMLAAKMIRENLPVPEKDTNAAVGARLHRVDAEEKALGTGKYADDIHMDGMIYAKALRSKYPRRACRPGRSRCHRCASPGTRARHSPHTRHWAGWRQAGTLSPFARRCDRWRCGRSVPARRRPRWWQAHWG